MDELGERRLTDLFRSIAYHSGCLGIQENGFTFLGYKDSFAGIIKEVTVFFLALPQLIEQVIFFS